MKLAHKKAISKALKGHLVSVETRLKIGKANRGKWVSFKCAYCNKDNKEQISKFKKTKRHFCGLKCYVRFWEEMKEARKILFKN